MNGLIVIPLVILITAAWFGIGFVIAEIAYERGYDDACHDWRATLLFRNVNLDAEVIEAEVIEAEDVWPPWAEVNAEESTAYPPSMN